MHPLAKIVLRTILVFIILLFGLYAVSPSDGAECNNSNRCWHMYCDPYGYCIYKYNYGIMVFGIILLIVGLVIFVKTRIPIKYIPQKFLEG